MARFAASTRRRFFPLPKPMKLPAVPLSRPDADPSPIPPQIPGYRPVAAPRSVALSFYFQLLFLEGGRPIRAQGGQIHEAHRAPRKRHRGSGGACRARPHHPHRNHRHRTAHVRRQDVRLRRRLREAARQGLWRSRPVGSTQRAHRRYRAPAAHAGGAFLMHQGYSLAWSGWDISAPAGGDRLTITVPVATHPDGSAITGPSYEYIVFDTATTASSPLAYPAATLDKS